MVLKPARNLKTAITGGLNKVFVQIKLSRHQKFDHLFVCNTSQYADGESNKIVWDKKKTVTS